MNKQTNKHLCREPPLTVYRVQRGKCAISVLQSLVKQLVQSVRNVE